MHDQVDVLAAGVEGAQANGKGNSDAVPVKNCAIARGSARSSTAHLSGSLK